MDRFHFPEGLGVKFLTFFGAMAAVLAQADDLTDPRYWMAGFAAGATAVLALTRSPGQPRPPVGGSRG